jgi:PIN domain nuclease of toxin-antitoxin system
MKRYLLDTHAFLWLASNDARLGDECRSVFLDPDSDVLLSMASVWEMAIKVSLGKLVLGRPLRRLVEGAPVLGKDESFDAYGVTRIW